MINLYSIRPKGFNVGNDVIFTAVQHFLRLAFKNEPFNIISLAATNKYESSKKAGFTGSTVYEINQFGDGVVLGGGNLYENGEIDVNLAALKALDKPLMIFSVSRGKVYNQNLQLTDRTDVISDGILSELNKKAAVSLSRDKGTFDYIKNNLGIDNITGACPTLFLNEVPQHSIPFNDKLKTDCLISIRTPGLMSIPPSYQYGLRDSILETIELLKERGYKNIKLLCHDHRDIPFASSFKEVEFLFTEDVYTFLTILKNTRLNVTYRLHSFVPCLALDIPAIKISYDERSLSLVDTIGMSDWNINFVKDNVISEIEHRLDNLKDLEVMKSKLKDTKWKEIRNTITTNCSHFAELILDKKNG